MMTSSRFEHLPFKLYVDELRWKMSGRLVNTYCQRLLLYRFSRYISTTDAFCALSERRFL